MPGREPPSAHGTVSTQGDRPQGVSERSGDPVWDAGFFASLLGLRPPPNPPPSTWGCYIWVLSVAVLFLCAILGPRML